MSQTRELVKDILDPTRDQTTPISEQDQEVIRVKQAVDRMAQTEDGKTLLRVICDTTGFDKPTTYINPQTGEVNPMRSLFIEAQRCVWLNLREWIPYEVLKEIEYPKEK